MICQYSGLCQNCDEKVTITILEGKLLENCPNCSGRPFNLKVYKGLVYVVNNPKQVGLKIGMSEKTVEQRIKALNSTGVVGSFKPIVTFPSDNPKKDEKKIHDKLAKFNISKEHFNLNSVEAALKCYRILNRRKPIFHNKNIEKEFWEQIEKDRQEIQKCLKGKSENTYSV